MKRRKVFILCIDAGSHDYLAASDIPNIRKLAETGFYQHANAVIPSVTNVNNVSIATGTFPETHGITTNYHVDRTTGRGEFVEDNRFLLAPTLFEVARTSKFAAKTALFVTKKKLLRMLETGADIAVAAEAPPSEYIQTAGPIEPIYSVEINWWLLRAVRETLRTHDPELVYCSTTDWVQHKHAPDADLSQVHLAELDRIIGDIIDDEPEREIYITADHGMLEKNTALDPGRVLIDHGIPASAIPIIKDRYIAHHNNLGGAAYVFLENRADTPKAIQTLLNTPVGEPLEVPKGGLLTMAIFSAPFRVANTSIPNNTTITSRWHSTLKPNRKSTAEFSSDGQIWMTQSRVDLKSRF